MLFITGALCLHSGETSATAFSREKDSTTKSHHKNYHLSGEDTGGRLTLQSLKVSERSEGTR